MAFIGRDTRPTRTDSDTRPAIPGSEGVDALFPYAGKSIYYAPGVMFRCKAD